MFRVKAPRDFGAAVVIMLIGIFGLYFGKDLTYGTAGRMGPGYFPFLLSMIIITLGATIGVKALFTEGPPIEAPMIRPMAFVVASIIVFGYSIDYFGLFFTSIILTFLAAYARKDVKIVETGIFAVGLALGTVLVFVYALGQPLPAWWGN